MSPLKIHERRLELFLEPCQHIVRHPPVLHRSSIFALADIAGIHDEQRLDRRQRSSTTLELQETLGFYEKAFLGVEALQ